jgi:hypothetical protein
MSYRFAVTSLALAATLGLAACNASSQPVASAPLQATDTADGTPPSYNLPQGAACTAEIDRYAKLVYGDNTTGMVSPSVFDQIKIEIAKAADTCRAGQDAQARAQIAASRHKHGYPA